MKEVKRPWGNFEVIYKSPGMTIKIITVKPNSRLSLQSHKKRDEVWLLIKGSLSCEICELEEEMKKGIAYVIPRKEKHRLMGKKKGGRVVEVSFGRFNEKDIVRYKDDYGRVKK